MNKDYSELSVMTSLPRPEDELTVVIGGNDKDTKRLPWDVLQTGFVGRQSEVPTLPTFALGEEFTATSDEEYFYFRNGTQWGRIPYVTDVWEDGYNQLLRPLAPHLATAPGDSPNGHYFYNTTLKVVQFKQDDTYVSLQPPQAFKTVTDGNTSATANQAGVLRFRSDNNSVSVVVTGNHPTYGDVIDLKINAANIGVGSFTDDNTYALKNHNHSGVYANAIHDHDGVYSPVVHNHNGVYSPVGHNHSGVYAPFTHNHSAGDINSGTLGDARISSSSVAQHAGSINHNALLNYSANRHIDHTSISISGASNGGLSGGGTLAASRTLSLDYTNLLTSSTADLNADSIVIHRPSVGLRRILLSALGVGQSNHTHSASQITTGVLLAERGGMGANSASFTGLIKMAGGIASVATPGADYAAASHTQVASTITDFNTAVTSVVNGIPSISDAVSKSHTQNTDTGTTGTQFQLDSGNSGGRVIWTSGEFQLRDSSAVNLVALRVGDLIVEGTTTTINSNEVDIGDSNILLNADLSTGSGNSDGGFSVKLLDSDNTTRRDAVLSYNVSTRRFEFTGFKPTTDAPVTRTAVAKYSETVGDNSNPTYSVSHSLNTTDVSITVIELSTGNSVIVECEVVDANTVEVTFGPNSIPEPASHRVIVTG